MLADSPLAQPSMSDHQVPSAKKSCGGNKSGSRLAHEEHGAPPKGGVRGASLQMLSHDWLLRWRKK